MIKFCGIDASMSRTGLSIVSVDKNRKFHLLDKTSLIVQTRYFEDRFDKKIYVRDMFEFWLEARIQTVSFFVFENYSYNGRGSIADLAELNGVLKHYIRLHKKPICYIAPATVKKIVGGHGRASKEDVRDGLRNFLVDYDDITFNNLDESDSAAVAVAYSIKMFEEIDKQ